MFELVVTKRYVEDSQFKFPYGLPVDSSIVAATAGCILIGNNDQESALAFFLDVKNTVVGFTEVCKGTIDSCPMDPRIILRPALLCPGIRSLILIHNHPSGDSNPSSLDDDVTRRLYSACVIVGIELLDHIIVEPKGKTFSYQESGKMRLISLSTCETLSKLTGGKL